MLVQVCPPEAFDLATQTCAGPVWVEMSAPLLSGWTVADLGALGGAVLTMLCIAYVIRLLHNLVNQL